MSFPVDLSMSQNKPHCRRNFVPCPSLAPVPVSQKPRWCWLSAEPLQEFHRVYLRGKKEGKRQTERRGEKETYQDETEKWTAIKQVDPGKKVTGRMMGFRRTAGYTKAASYSKPSDKLSSSSLKLARIRILRERKTKRPVIDGSF